MALSVISKNMFWSICLTLFLGILTEGLPLPYKGVRCGSGDNAVDCVMDGAINELVPEFDQVDSPPKKNNYMSLDVDQYSGEEPGSGTEASSSEDIDVGDDSSSDERSGSEDAEPNEDENSGYGSSTNDDDISDNEDDEEDSAYEMEGEEDEEFNDEMLKENFIL